MKLEEYLQEDFVLPDLTSSGKTEVLAELIEPLGRRFPGFDLSRAHQVLIDRERLGTTGIGDGVAIPHGKLDDLEEIILVVGRSKEGLDFEALDFKPCRIFFLVLAPEQVAGMHLRILAHISRLLKDDSFRKAFMEAPDRETLWSLLSRA